MKKSKSKKKHQRRDVVRTYDLGPLLRGYAAWTAAGMPDFDIEEFDGHPEFKGDPARFPEWIAMKGSTAGSA